MLQVILTDQNYAVAASMAANEHESVSAWLNKLIESQAGAAGCAVEPRDRHATSEWLMQLEGRLR